MPSVSHLDRLAARVRAYHQTADPDQLWPDVPRVLRLDGHRRIVSATRAILLDGGAVLEAPDDRAARAIGIAAFESGTGPLLGWWAERGFLQTDQRVNPLLATHLAHGRSRAKKLREATSAVLRAFRERGITPVLLKGAHMADAYFPEPGTRAGTDVDVLVEPRQLDPARDALRACGFVESRCTKRPFHSEWTPAGQPQRIHSLEFNHADNPWSIDLHISLERPYPGNLLASLGLPGPGQTAEHTVDGLPSAVLRQPLLAAYLAIHAGWIIHEIQLVRLVELAMVLRRDAAQAVLDPQSLIDLLQRTDTARFAFPAIRLVEHLAPGTVPARVLDTVVSAASRTARRVVAGLADSGAYRLPGRSAAEKFMWARGLREHLLAALDAVWSLDASDDRWTLLRRRAWMLLSRRARIVAP